MNSNSPLSAGVFVIGYPSALGGANTELWHTIKLWRRFGVKVTLVPTWKADRGWRVCLDALGCRTVESNPDDLQNVPGLKGGIVVSLCNTKFLAAAQRFRELDCRIVWLGCMNWLFPEERLHYRKHGPFHFHVFQSRYQRDQLAPQLRRFGWRNEQGAVIRGALDLDEFPWRPLPHTAGGPLVLGRVSRPDADKFPRDLWQQFSRIDRPVQYRILGWSKEAAARAGLPPRWAECLPPCGQPVPQFLGALHALAPGLGAAVENWPRYALESMAAGVPLVVEETGGTVEMIEHGQTGYLCESVEEMAGYVERLADDEPGRMRMIVAARAAVERLADPAVLWEQWREVFHGLAI
jgi:glycosyltransferase involved in cell wall biosynthesis